jgi:hypothetical protein
VKLPHKLQACEDERRERMPQPLRTALAEMSARCQQDAVLALAVGTSKVVHQSSHQILLFLKIFFIDVLPERKAVCMQGVSGVQVRCCVTLAQPHTPLQGRPRRP